MVLKSNPSSLTYAGPPHGGDKKTASACTEGVSEGKEEYTECDSITHFEKRSDLEKVCTDEIDAVRHTVDLCIVCRTLQSHWINIDGNHVLAVSRKLKETNQIGNKF